MMTLQVDLFNFLSESILREFQVLPEFFISVHNCNNMRSADYIRLMVNKIEPAETPEQGREKQEMIKHLL